MIRSTAVILFISLQAIACRQENNNEGLTRIVNNYVGKKFALPTDSVLQIERNGDNRTQLELTHWSIVTSINGDCGSCVAELQQWDSLVTEYKKITDVNFYTFVSTQDFDRFRHVFQNNLQYSYPVYYDKSGAISRLFPQEYGLQAFLINGDRIVVVGNPVLNKKVSRLYSKHLTAGASR